jgi:hypothetical protein
LSTGVVEDYLGEGTGVAARLIATPDGAERVGSMDGETYEQWVAGIDVETGSKKGRVRDDVKAPLRGPARRGR